MMIAIPNMDKPKNAFECSTKINPEERMCIYTGKVFEETLSLLLDRPCGTCPLIEIVRCKECIYNTDNTDDDNRGWCYKHGIDIIGFCSEGEKK